MTVIDWYINEHKMKLLEEKRRFQRHEDFIRVMELNKEDKRINWNCYWTWYHQSKCDAETALLEARG